jgi:hypothetical protein
LLENDILIVLVKWSKTIQFGERILSIPLINIPDTILCPLVNYFLLSNFDIEIGTKLDFRLIVKKAIKNRHQQTLSNDFSISKCLYVSLSTPGEIFQQKIIFP